MFGDKIKKKMQKEDKTVMKFSAVLFCQDMTGPQIIDELKAAIIEMEIQNDSRGNFDHCNYGNDKVDFRVWNAKKQINSQDVTLAVLKMTEEE